MQLSVSNNGHITLWFCSECSILQGLPPAPLIFLLPVEILVNLLKHSEEIKPYSLAGVEQLVSQFADDMDIFMKYDKKSLQSAIDILSYFQYQMGLHVNYNKTSVYRIGSLKHTNAKLYTTQELKWMSDTIMVLGVKIAHEQIIIKLLFCYKSFRSCYDNWNKRELSLMGKILIINMLMISLFTYKMQVLPLLPLKYENEIEIIFKKYMWDGKGAKLMLDLIKSNKSDGGLAMIDLAIKDMSLKIHGYQQCLMMK